MSSIAETKAAQIYPTISKISNFVFEQTKNERSAFTAGRKEGAIAFAEWFSQKDRPATATWEQLYEVFNQGAHV